MIALTIAGSDSGGGAGVQADLKVFSAHGVYGASVITAITAQNTLGVRAVHEVPAQIVAAQLEAVLDDLDVKAIKIGMLFSVEIIDIVSKILRDRKIPIVLDPVMIAKSGDRLLQDAAVNSMVEKLFPLANLLTPNLPEAEVLLGVKAAHDSDEMQLQAAELLGFGAKSILLKGGHGIGEICTDILVFKHGEMLRLDAKRIDTQNTHGTGCTYSAAIAANLAKGVDLKASVVNAHGYLQQAIKFSDRLEIGSGYGPVHHFYEMWGAK